MECSRALIGHVRQTGWLPERILPSNSLYTHNQRNLGITESSRILQSSSCHRKTNTSAIHDSCCLPSRPLKSPYPGSIFLLSSHTYSPCRQFQFTFFRCSPCPERTRITLLNPTAFWWALLWSLKSTHCLIPTGLGSCSGYAPSGQGYGFCQKVGSLDHLGCVGQWGPLNEKAPTRTTHLNRSDTEPG